MNNKEVAHLWANQSRRGATGSHFYFSGDTIYSYGAHFPIARHYKGCVLFTTRGYSSTTSTHKGCVHSACSHLPVFEVEDPTRNPSGRDVQNYAQSVKQLIAQCAKARNPAAAMQSLEREIAQANAFCERFGFKTRFAMPDNWAELKERAKQSAERERKAKAEREARVVRAAQEAIAKWLAGESVSIPWCVNGVYLRARNGNMETSKGARVTLEEAHKAFRFATAKRATGWTRNGEQFPVGDYHLDAVNEFGVIAGCHRVAWGEIERFAALQKW